MGAKVSPAMEHAQKLVTKDGLTPYKAAKLAGISKSAIYMSAWWKAYKVESVKDGK